MSIKLIKNNFIEAKQLLDHFINDEKNLEKIAQAGDLLVQVFKNGGTAFSCGNGGSMCDAIHFAEELTGKFREERMALPAIAISDSGYLSCVGNDYGYDEIFARFISGVAKKGDVLLAISTSGNSKNILRAAEVAKDKGVFVIGLTGKDGGKLANLCDVEIRVPHNGYADRIQEIHIKIIHSLIHYIEEKIV
ncbi:MAG: phosphoheptose isomerase [Flavobacteriales bacterium]|nr:phosphoheptose isomerase [Flavobacteriales bacterium]|tara:strand:- start:48039 stop:48614 length:576 start_codon:yes stop_codon:yes gene_type:complete